MSMTCFPYGFPTGYAPSRRLSRRNADGRCGNYGPGAADEDGRLESGCEPGRAERAGVVRMVQPA